MEDLGCNMTNNRKQRLLEKIAARGIMYTRLGGLKLKNPKAATEVIEEWLKKNPKGTAKELVEKFAPGRPPGLGGNVV